MAKINTITPDKHVFLKRLCFLAKSPKRLCYMGEIPRGGPLLNTTSRFVFERTERPFSVAIVGSRKSTKYGEENAYKIAYELTRLGFVVVSGLAIGIDAAAHRGALDAGGRTVGVLGTPITEVYPAKNRPLAARIIENGGMVMSEFADKTEMTELKTNAFLYRNRLIAGLADVVIVVEASRRSGSLNTAHHALLTGVPVMAVPGDVGRKKSVGCNRLFREGAAPCLDYLDVLDELGISY